MARVMESISVINSAIRTLLAVVVVGGVGAGGWYAYSLLNASEAAAERTAKELAAAQAELQQQSLELQRKNEEIGALNTQVQQQQEQIEKLDTALRLLKVNHRVARISVLDQATDPASGKVLTTIQFQELNEQGEPVEGPKQFQIQGDMVYIDSWVVKFDDKYVEQADIDRATSLVMFRRIFGEYQEPTNGFMLDTEGARPQVYGRGGKMSDFEKQIWDDFWSVANDEARQADLGIRAAHGDAPSIKVEKGKVYRIELRASDGLSISPEAQTVPQPTKPAA